MDSGTTQRARPLTEKSRLDCRLSSCQRRVTALLGVGVFLVAGCVSTESAGTQSLGAEVLQDLSPFEMRVLKDKHVTRAELDEATQIYIECLQAAGLRVDIDPSQEGMAAVWAEGIGLPDSAAGDPVEECSHQVDAVENVWILQNHVSAADLNQMRAQLVSCLRDAGLPINDGATFDDAARAYSEFMESLGSYSDGSSEGVRADKAGVCQQEYQGVSGAQPLPGLQEALGRLDTSAW